MLEFACNYTHIDSENVKIEREKVNVKVHKVESDLKRLKINDLLMLTNRQLRAYEILCDVIKGKYILN